MPLDRDAFLCVVYCLVDDLYRAYLLPRKPSPRGRPAVVSDAELLTLALLCQWRRDRSERAFVAWARGHLYHLFPRQLSQSAFNRRVRALGGALAALGPRLADRLDAELGGPAPYEVVDGAPVPLMRLCRGRRHRCFGDEAGF